MRPSNALLLVQLPPPIHGASSINARVAAILSAPDELNKITNKAIRLNYATNFQEMQASGIKKAIYTIRLLRLIVGEYLKNRPEITYIAFSPFGLGFYRDVFLVGLARLFFSTPYLHLHGTGLSRKCSTLKSVLLKWMLRKSKLILISPSLYQDVADFVPQGNVVVIENCVDDPGAPQKKNGLDEVNILYLANLDERKGVKIAIEAFEKIKSHTPDAKLFIAGADTSLLTKNSLQAYIVSNHSAIQNDINIIGPVYGDEKHKLFSSSDVFLYPSGHDAAPLVVLEALSYGIPVICSAQGALPDMVMHGRNGFVSHKNTADEYSSLFKQCLSDIEKLSMAARRSYIERYSPQLFEKRIKDLFLSGS